MTEDTLIMVNPTELLSMSNVRTCFDETGIASLAASLGEVGLLQPIRCRRGIDGLEIIDGARRCLAANRLGWSQVAVVVDAEAISDAGMIQRQLIANCQRANLLPSEHASGIRDLMAQTKWTASDTAKKIGTTPSSITKLLSILALPQEVIDWVDQGRIPISQAYEFSKLKSPDEQYQAALRQMECRGRKPSIGNLPKKQEERKSTGKAGTKVQLDLPDARITLSSGEALDMDSLATLLQGLLARIRKERKRSLTLSTFAKLLQDQLVKPSLEQETP